MRTIPARRVLVAALLSTVGLACRVSVVAAQDETANVGVTIEAPFYDQLGADQREEVEARIAGFVVGLGTEHYPFLRWRSDDSSVPRLAVYLREDPNVASVCPVPAMNLELFGIPPSGSEIGLPDAAGVLPLIESCRFVTASDTVVLRARAQAVLDSAFRQEGFRRGLERGLISLIPFTDRLEPGEGIGVILPLECKQMLLGDNSSLVVLFEERESLTEEERDRKQLSLHQPIAIRAGRAFLLSALDQAADTRAELVQALVDERLSRLDVYVKEYFRTWDCERLLDDPGAGGSP